MKNILIVDDDAEILETLRVAWPTSPAVEIRTANSGATALDAIASKRPDLLLSDYKMPGMDGIELVRRAREQCPDLACVMMTAYPEHSLAERVQREAGANMLIAKPFNLEFLVAGIHAVLGKTPMQDGPKV